MVLAFHNKLYVGVQGQKKFDKTDPPLAFATQYTEDATFTKRKSTVDNWAGYNRTRYEYVIDDNGRHIRDDNGRFKQNMITPPEHQEGEYIDNDPIEGFYFEKAVTRWETSNKWFRINDPRGFQLEISAYNLGDILLNSHISKGYLVGKFVWAKEGQKVYLCREDHPDRLEKLDSAVTREKKELRLGDVVRLGNANEKYVYIGKYYFLGFNELHRYRRTDTQEVLTYSVMQRVKYPQLYSYTWPRTESNILFEDIHYLQWRRDKQAYHCFKPIDNEYPSLLCRKTPGKYTVLGEGREVEPLTQVEMDSVTGPEGTLVIPFASKALLNDYDVTNADLEGMYNKYYLSGRAGYGAQTKPMEFIGRLEAKEKMRYHYE